VPAENYGYLCGMRVDKFLWSVRLFKTRKLASEACRQGKVQLDKVESKPGKDVREGCIIDLRKEGITYSYKVKTLPPSRVGAPRLESFIEDITKKEELERLEFIRLTAKLNRQKGTGRPTKKDRRDIDRLTDH